MILEGIVTTINADETVNISPMGPLVESEQWEHFILKPYNTSQTWQNLRRDREGVLHITDDVELLARAAVGPVDPLPPLGPAETVAGQVLEDVCRWYEFRVSSFDDSAPRIVITCDVILSGRKRDFFGFNRAKHAVLEAAILATRTKFLPRDEILTEFERLAVIVDKTGGEQERRAFEYLRERLAISG
jgi:hypothetical protein